MKQKQRETEKEKIWTRKKILKQRSKRKQNLQGEKFSLFTTGRYDMRKSKREGE